MTPDLTIETMQMCKSIDGPITIKVGSHYVSGLFSERHSPTCDCMSFIYRKRCRHLLEAEKSACGWHEQWSDEPQTTKGICPRCGGPTIPVRVAV